MSEPFLTASDDARLLQVHVETVYLLIAKRGLPAFKIGRHWRFEEAQVRTWLESHYATPSVVQGALEQKGP